ncbi:MAG: ABC transporter substrate-binding protein [Methanomicrobiales archaeon]
MNKYILIVMVIFIGIITVYSSYNYYETVENTVYIGYLPSNHHAALFVAQEKDLFEKEGIRVQLVPFRNGEDLLRSAEKGQIDMGYCGITPVISALDRGEQIKVVAAVNQEGSGIVVSEDIKNVTDFKGKKIAIPKNGSIQDVLLRYYLYKNNINLEDVNIAELEVSVMLENINNDFIDIYMAWEPYASQSDISSNDKGRVFVYSDSIFENHPCCVVIATDDFIKTNPKLLRQILKIHVDSTNYIKNHTEETAYILSKKLVTDVQLERVGLKHVEYIAVPSSEFIDNVMVIYNIQKDLGYVKQNITADEIFDLRYLP